MSQLEESVRIGKQKSIFETEIFCTWTWPVTAVSNLSLGASAGFAAVLRSRTVARSLSLPSPRTATGRTCWPQGPRAPNPIHWKEKRNAIRCYSPIVRSGFLFSLFSLALNAIVASILLIMIPRDQTIIARSSNISVCLNKLFLKNWWSFYSNTHLGRLQDCISQAPC